MKSIFTLIALGALVSGCGGSSSSTDVVGVDLVGVWKTPCTSSSGQYKQQTLTFTAPATMTLTEGTYGGSDTTCATPAYVSVVTATVTAAGTDATTPSGAKNIDYTFVSLNATPKTSAFVTLLNSGSVCGVSTWAIDVATDIAGKTCAGTVIASVDAKVQDIYKIDGTTLYQGAGTTGQTTRVTTLSTVAFTKQ